MTAPETMQAVVVRKPGGVEELAIERVEFPELGPGCIEIDVKAAALNRADLLQRRGLYPPPRGASPLLGLECAGVVRRCAPDVTEYAPGARVMALLAGGGYAERAVVPAGQVMPMPAAASFAEAAAIPEAFLTASEALFTLAGTRASELVLIHAAAGGVGSAAVQLAKHIGARVVACAGSIDKCEWLRELGADRVVNRRNEDFVAACKEESSGRGADVVLDFVGASYAEQHQRCIAEAGRWIVLGLLSGAKASLDLSVVLRLRLSMLGLVMRTRSLADKQAIVARFTQRFLPEFDRGRLRPLIDRIYPVSEVRAAHSRMENDENRGKIVLSFT